MTPSRQEGLKGPKDLRLDVPPNVLQSIDHHVGLGRSRVRKRDVEPKTVLHAHIRVRWETGEFGHYCAALDYPPSEPDELPLNLRRRGPIESDIDRLKPVRCHEYMSMLVDVVEVSEDGERVVLLSTRLPVRLQPTDRCDSLGGYAGQVSPAERSPEAVDGVADGELDCLRRSPLDPLPLQLSSGQRVGEVIQGAPHVVDGVSEKKAEAKRDGWDFEKAKAAFGCLGISLDPYFTELWILEELVGGTFETIEVLACSF